MVKIKVKIYSYGKGIESETTLFLRKKKRRLLNRVKEVQKLLEICIKRKDMRIMIIGDDEKNAWKMARL